MIEWGNMEENKCFEKYPYWFAVIANLVQLAIYVIGAYIINYLGLIWLIFYLLYIVLLEFRLLKRSCVNCYYYGKVCFSGRGKICSALLKKGDPQKFINDKVKFIDVLPDFLVSIIPMIIGIILLIIHFELLLALFIAALFLLTFVGNGLIRGSFACKYCKQRELGCPAQRLFDRTKK